MRTLTIGAALLAWLSGAALAGSPLTDASSFPIAVFDQQPNDTGINPGGRTLAQEAVLQGMNIMIGVHPSGNWPSGFGTDDGTMAAVKAAGIYIFGGNQVPYTENTSAHSVASIIALATAQGATANLLGYDMGDEPQCGFSGNEGIENVPTVVSAIAGFDPTRIAFYNYLNHALTPNYEGHPCFENIVTAWQTTQFLSFDIYPITHPYGQFTGSNYLDVPFDSIWKQGLGVIAMKHYGRPGQKLWAFIESGGDNLGLSESNNITTVTTSNTSSTIVNASGESVFTSSWVGLTVAGTGIQAGSTISSITDPTHAVISLPATASGTITMTITGGSGGNDCIVSLNICVAHGNRWRATPSEVNAEVWNSLIAGANGIEWFCDDLTRVSFCLDSTGSADSQVVVANITYIDNTVLTYAPMLNSTTSGVCSMQSIDYTLQTYPTTTSCTDGSLTIATSNSAVPGLALLKHYGSDDYLFVQSDRRSTSGATFTMTLAGMGGRTVQTVYDSNSQYDSAHNSTGASATINGSGVFTDTLGANSDHYQVKIYKILTGGGGGGGCCHGLRVENNGAPKT